jgi:hypothetical protein
MTLTEQSKAFTFISLSEIKKHLHINEAYTDDDGYIDTLLEVATKVVENDTSRTLADTTFIINDTLDKAKEYTIEIGSVRSIEAITLDGSVFTGYTIEKGDFKSVLTFDEPVSGDISITLKAGFTATEKDKVLIQCILIKVFGLYDNERSEFNSMNYYKNNVYENLVNFYKKERFL